MAGRNLSGDVGKIKAPLIQENNVLDSDKFYLLREYNRTYSF
jgi:hypothetical protein